MSFNSHSFQSEVFLTQMQKSSALEMQPLESHGPSQDRFLTAADLSVVMPGTKEADFSGFTHLQTQPDTGEERFLVMLLKAGPGDNKICVYASPITAAPGLFLGCNTHGSAEMCLCIFLWLTQLYLSENCITYQHFETLQNVGNTKVPALHKFL